MTDAPLILVVEAEQGVAEVMRRALCAAGYAVRQAREVGVALEVLGTETVAAVVMSVGLPSAAAAGPAAGSVLRQAWPNLRVLVTSGLSCGLARRLGLLPPGAAFLAKPFTSIDLVQAVKATLETSIEPLVEDTLPATDQVLRLLRQLCRRSYQRFSPRAMRTKRVEEFDRRVETLCTMQRAGWIQLEVLSAEGRQVGGYQRKYRAAVARCTEEGRKALQRLGG
jgi:DNA-binding NtrC family response regulator